MIRIGKNYLVHINSYKALWGGAFFYVLKIKGGSKEDTEDIYWDDYRNILDKLKPEL